MLRSPHILAGTLLALAASVSVAAAQDAPACACAVPMTVGSAPLGSLTEVNGNVMVTQAAGYVAAQEGTGLLPGSRVVLGSDASATLRIGEDCSLDLLPNSTATLLSTDQQLCVQLATPQTAAQSSTIVSPKATYGQSVDGASGVNVPLAIFGTAVLGAAGGALADDDDDDESPVSD
jgi:hypothetical protein